MVIFWFFPFSYVWRYRITAFFNMTSEENIRLLFEPIRYYFRGSESDFEKHVTLNMDLICEALSLPKISVISNQKTVKVFDFYVRPDILVRHVDGSLTIFEVKKVNDKNPATSGTNQLAAIGQLLLYRSAISRTINNTIRLAIIDNKISTRTYFAVVGNELPITLLELQKNRLFVPYDGW